MVLSANEKYMKIIISNKRNCLNSDYFLPNRVLRFGQLGRFQNKIAKWESVNLEGSDLLTICRQKKLCCIFLRQPSNLVDLLLDLKTFQVVKLRFVALESAVNVVLSSALWLILTLNDDRPEI